MAAARLRFIYRYRHLWRLIKNIYALIRHPLQAGVFFVAKGGAGLWRVWSKVFLKIYLRFLQ